MADDKLKQRVMEELRRRGAVAAPPAPAPQPLPPPPSSPGVLSRAADLLNQGVTAAQKNAQLVLGNVLDPSYFQNFTIPFTDNASLPLTSLPGGALLATDAGRLLAARAYQSVNPFASGAVGEGTVEANPYAQRGAVQLADMLGDVPAAALQAGAQIVPGALVEAGAGAVARAPQVARTGYTALSQALPRMAQQAARTGGVSMGVNAAQAALGAAEGQRADTFTQAMTDPAQAVPSFLLGALPATAVEGLALRRANAAALADIAGPPPARAPETSTPAPDPVTQQHMIAAAQEPVTLPAMEELTQLTQLGRNQLPELPAPMQRSVLAPIPARREAGAMLYGAGGERPPAFNELPTRNIAVEATVPPVVPPGARTPPVDAPTRAYADLPLAMQRDMDPQARAQYIIDAANQLQAEAPGFSPAVGVAAPRASAPAAGTVVARAPATPLPSRIQDVDPAFVGTQLAAPSELPNPKSAAQRGNWKTYVGTPQGMRETFSAPAEVPSPPPAQAAANPLVSDMDVTNAMDLIDVAKATGENPAKAREVLYGPGAKNMGAAGRGDDTQIKWNRDILREQQRKADKPMVEQTQQLTDPQVIAEINASKDKRTVEMPGDPIPPGGLPPDVDVPGAAADDAAHALRRIREERNPNLLQEVAKKWGLPEHRAFPLEQAAIRGYKAAGHIQNVQFGKVFPMLRAAYTNAGKDGRRLIDNFVRQNLNRQTPTIPVEALPREFRELFQAGVEQNRFYRDELVKAGYFSPQQIKAIMEQEKAGLVWLHRDYKAYLDNSYLPDRGLMDRAIRWTVKKSEGRLNYGTAANELIALMSGTGDMQNRFRQSRLNREILKERANIPPIIRDLLGEVHNPAYVTAASMSEVERLWRQHKVSQTFTSPEYKGVLWDNQPNAAMHEARVWNDNMSAFENKRSFGEFAGKYVSPQLYEAIMQAPSPVMRSTLQRVGAFVTGMFKTAKVALSPVSYMNNWISNSANAAAAGLPVWNRRFAPRLMQSARALEAYNKTFTTQRQGVMAPESGDGQWAQWALEDGALIPGTGAEFGGSQARMIAQRFLQEPEDGLVGLLQAGWNQLQQGKAKLGGIYDALDSHWRLAVYIEQVSKGVDRLGLPLPEARSRASRIINENFASSGSVGQAVREMSNQYGFLAPFMTWHADNIRVHLNWLRNSGKGFKPTSLNGQPVPGAANSPMSGEGSAQAFNVAMHYGLIAGLFELTRRLAGFTDQDVAVAEASTKGSFKAYSPAPVREWLPWRDAKGRAQVISLVPLFPSAAFLKGDPKQFLLSRIMQNIVLGFVQSGAAEDSVKRKLELLGLSERDFTPEVLPGQEGRAALEAAWNYIEPGLIRDVRNVARRTQLAGQLRRFEEPYTTGQALAAFTPFKAEPVGRQSQESERVREIAQRKDVQGDLRTVNRMAAPFSEKQRMRAAIRAELEKRVREASQRSQQIRGDTNP